MTTDDIAAIVITVVSAQVHDAHAARGGQVPIVLLESKLRDGLGLDDLDVVEIITRCEEKIGRDLPDEHINGHSTVADLIELVSGRMG